MDDEKITITLTVKQARLLRDAAFYWDGHATNYTVNDDDTVELMCARWAIRDGLRDVEIREMLSRI